MSNTNLTMISVEIADTVVEVHVAEVPEAEVRVVGHKYNES